MTPFDNLARAVTFRPLVRPVVCAGRFSRFRASWADTAGLLENELRAIRAQQPVMEVDFREQDFRIDGLPRAGRSARTPGVVLSFVAGAIAGKPALRYEIGTYRSWEDNVRAIAKGLEALRAVDRYGITRRGEQYAGWKALTSGSGVGDPHAGAAIIKQHGSFAAAIKANHPDTGANGGDSQAYADLIAYKEAREAA